MVPTAHFSKTPQSGEENLAKRVAGTAAVDLPYDVGLQPLRDCFGPSPADLVPVMLRYCLAQSVNAAVLVGFTTPGRSRRTSPCHACPLTAEDLLFIRDTAGSIQRRLDAAGEVFLDEAKASRR